MRLMRFALAFCSLALLLVGLIPFAAAQDDLPRFEPGRCPSSVPSGKDAECGFLIVPEDRTNPDPDDTIALQVVIFPARDANPAPDPIIYLEGGPGGNAIETLAFNTRYEPYTQKRDLIFIDQRGVGLSQPVLDCPEYNEAALDMLPLDLTPEEASERVHEALEACRDRLESEGVNLGAYNSAANAADIADLRVALGYDEWNLWGISYGTRLALTIMRDHPEGVRSVILDSVYPPQVNLFGGAPDNFQRALAVLFEGCAAHPACNSAYPDLENTFYAAVDQLNENPVMLSIVNPLNFERYDLLYDGSSFMALIFQLLYDTSTIPTLPQLIVNVYEGKYGTVAQFEGALLANAEFISAGMYYSVECAEELSFETEASLATVYEEALSDAPPQLQEYYTGAAQDIIATCDLWNVPQSGAHENDPISSDIPTLVMSGEYDPVTPPAWGALAAETLTNSSTFIYPGVGHGASVSGETCPLKMALAFFDDPFNTPDSSCIAEMKGPDFDTPQESLALTTVTVSTFAGEVEAIVPEGWSEIAPGAYAESASATTAIVYQAVPGGSVNALLPTLIGQFGGDADEIETLETRDANGLTWTLYQAEASGFLLYVATASDDGTGYLIIVLTNPDQAEFYYDNLFIPAVDGFEP